VQKISLYFSIGSELEQTNPTWEKKSKKKYDPTAKRPNRLCDPYGQGGNPMTYAMAEQLKKTIHSDWIFEMPPEPDNVSNKTNNDSVPVQSSSSSEASDNSKEPRFTSAEEVQSAVSDMNGKQVEVDATDVASAATSSGSSIALSLFAANEKIERASVSSPLSPPTESAPTVTTTATDASASSRPPPLALIRSFKHPDFISASRFLHTIATVAQLNAHYPTLCIERQIIHRQWYSISTIKCHTKVLDGLSASDFHLALVRCCLENYGLTMLGCTERDFVTYPFRGNGSLDD
jgi:pterin-4a-carbinolamine dehydratase